MPEKQGSCHLPAQTGKLAELLQMKRDGRKSVGVVAWDYQLARIADRAGVDIVSVGDSVGVNLWGHSNPLEVTMDEMLVVCKAVRRGVTRALVSCDFPYGPPFGWSRKAAPTWSSSTARRISPRPCARSPARASRSSPSSESRPRLRCATASPMAPSPRPEHRRRPR